jgi:hypothetical protein
LPRIQKTPDLPMLAIKNKPDSFSPALRTTLQADYAASAKVKEHRLRSLPRQPGTRLELQSQECGNEKRFVLR